MCPLLQLQLQLQRLLLLLLPPLAVAVVVVHPLSMSRSKLILGRTRRRRMRWRRHMESSGPQCPPLRRCPLPPLCFCLSHPLPVRYLLLLLPPPLSPLSIPLATPPWAPLAHPHLLNTPSKGTW